MPSSGRGSSSIRRSFFRGAWMAARLSCKTSSCALPTRSGFLSPQYVQEAPPSPAHDNFAAAKNTNSRAEDDFRLIRIRYVTTGFRRGAIQTLLGVGRSASGRLIRCFHLLRRIFLPVSSLASCCQWSRPPSACPRARRPFRSCRWLSVGLLGFCWVSSLVTMRTFFGR